MSHIDWPQVDDKKSPRAFLYLPSTNASDRQPKAPADSVTDSDVSNQAFDIQTIAEAYPS